MFRVVKLLSLLISLTLGSEKVYDGFKVYDIKVKSESDLKFLKYLDVYEGEVRSLDFLSFHNNVNDIVKLLVKPEEQDFIEAQFKSRELDYKIMLDNVQE